MSIKSGLAALMLAGSFALFAQNGVIHYPNGDGFINDQGIPEYQSKNAPKRAAAVKQRRPRSFTLGPITFYEHGMGFYDAHGTGVYQPFQIRDLSILAEQATKPRFSAPEFPANRTPTYSGLGVNPKPAQSQSSNTHAVLNCPPVFGIDAKKITVDSDPYGSASILGTPGNGTYEGFFSTNPASWQVTSVSSDPIFGGLTGTMTSTSGGNQYTLSGTATVGNPPQTGTRLSLSVQFPLYVPGVATAAPQVTFSEQPTADPGPTTWIAQAVTPIYGVPWSCFNAGAAGDPVSADTGESISDPAGDFSLGGPLPLVFKRHYSSFSTTDSITGRLGTNWTHNFEIKLQFFQNSTVTVQLWDGGQMAFTSSGANWTLSEPQALPYQFVQTGSTYQFLDAETNLIYSFDSAGGLTAIQHRNGNTLTVTQPNQVSDGLGRTLTLAYGSDGNLATVMDQTGRMVSYTYSSSGNLASVTDTTGKVTNYSYTSAGGLNGLVASVVRPNGNTTLTQTFDFIGRVASQTDGTGHTTTFSYGTPAAGAGTTTSGSGDQTEYADADLRNNNSVTDGDGNATSLIYDSADRPTEITDALGNKTLIAYDAKSGLPSSITDATGAVTSFSYTAQVQGPFTFYVLSKETDADGNSSNYTYDANGNQLSATDPAGQVTQFTYNSKGQVLTLKNPLGGVTTYTYNSDGTAASVATPAGNVTQFAYDAQKRPIKVTHPDGTTDGFAYDARDRIVQHTPASGAPETFTFDANGNAVSITDLSGATTAIAYNGNDAATSVKDATGATSSAGYDSAARANSLTDGAGDTTAIAYDADGQTLSMVDANGAGDHFAWKADGYLESSTDALSRTTSYTSDALGRMLSVTTPLAEKWSYAYDPAGRLLSATTPLANTAKFTYDSRGNEVSAALPAGIGASYAYNNSRELAGITDPNGGMWALGYNNTGLPNAFTDPLHRTTSVTFDTRNRPASVTNSAGSATLSYDSLGDLIEAKFSDGTDLKYQYAAGRLLTAGANLALDYDGDHRVISSNGIASTRDGAGRLSTVTYAPGKVVTYKYNNLGELAEVDDWVGGVTKFQYDAAHELTAVTRPNGCTTQYSYDQDGRPIGKTYANKDGTTYSYTLVRDAEGKVTSANRVTPQLPQPATGLAGYAYDAANQISGNTYDGLGRLQSDGVLTYSWNLASRLTSYSGAGGAAQFTYDGLGLRVSSTTSADAQDFVWNYAHTRPALAIVRSGGADVRYYIYLPDGSLMHSIEAGTGARHFYHFDETGSTAFLTDDAGTVSDSYGITPFGESVAHSGATVNPFTFHGAWGVMQESGNSLYYMRARYYDSASQRFLSRDPAPQLDPLAIDPYQFALNNPVSFRDPSGASSEPSNLLKVEIPRNSIEDTLPLPSFHPEWIDDCDDWDEEDVLEALLFAMGWPPLEEMAPPPADLKPLKPSM